MYDSITFYKLSMKIISIYLIFRKLLFLSFERRHDRKKLKKNYFVSVSHNHWLNKVVDTT